MESTLVVSSAFEGVGQSEYCPSLPHPLHCVRRSTPSNWLRPPWEPCTIGTSLCDWPKRLDLLDALSEIFFSRPSLFPLWNPNKPSLPCSCDECKSLFATSLTGSVCWKARGERGKRKARWQAIACTWLLPNLSLPVYSSQTGIWWLEQLQFNLSIFTRIDSYTCASFSSPFLWYTHNQNDNLFKFVFYRS